MLTRNVRIPTAPRISNVTGVARAAVALFGIALSLTFSTAPLCAQRGDRADEKQPEIWRAFDVPPAPVLTPSQALDSFRVAPGFQIEVVAAEPLVEDPVAIRWDEYERLWVVEMRGFMPDVDGHGEREPVGQVVVLEDIDGDGRMDKRTVFLDKLVMPRAIALMGGAVWVAEPPNLWLCRDTDGDLKCDEKVALTQYGSDDPDVVEHTENGLRRALDNWIYNAKSSRRFRIVNGKLIEDATQFRGQWGIAQDDSGRLYYNGNSSYLYGDLLPSDDFEGHSHIGRAINQATGVAERLVRDESVYSIRVNTGINRGYQKHMLRADGHLARTTSVAGLAIYRASLFAEDYRGNAFVPEPAGNVLSVFSLTPNGVEIIAEKRLYEDPDFGKREFLASTDERFRPVDCEVGPDGALYVVDLYRGILQHRRYVTTFLRKQILERGLDKPIGLGRIYRIAPIGATPKKAPILGTATTAQRLEALASPTGWRRDTAQRLLIESGDSSLVEPLERIAVDPNRPLAGVHALWTLEGLGAIRLDVVKAASQLPSEAIQIAALRVGAALPSSDRPRFHTDVVRPLLASPHARARAHAMLTLANLRKRLPKTIDERSDVDRDAIVAAFVRGLASSPERAAALACWHDETIALADAISAFAMKQASDGSAPAGCRDALREVASLAAHADAERALQSYGDWCRPTRAAWQITAVVEGLAVSLGKRKKTLELAAPPAMFALGSREIRGITAKQREAMRKQLATIAKKLHYPGAAANPIAPVALTAADRRRMEASAPLWEVCSVCHGADGKGQPTQGPPLIDSPWINGPEERLVRILLQGLQGPLEINGKKWNNTMPGLQVAEIATEENIAGLLTRLRRSWGHSAAPIRPERVGAIRQATRGRTEPWTVPELLQVPADVAPDPKSAPRGSAWRELIPDHTDGDAIPGWVQRGGKAVYRLEGKLIVGRCVPNTANSFLCTIERFGDFELEYEFLIDPELNSGVQIRSESDPDYRHGVVHGYQVEIDPDPRRKRFWSGGIYDESRRGWIADLSKNAAARTAFRQESWNRIRVVAIGPSLKTWINGVAAADLIDSMTLEGFVGLQVHGVGQRHESLQVRWRGLRIREFGRHHFAPIADDFWQADSKAEVLTSREAHDSITLRIRFTPQVKSMVVIGRVGDVVLRYSEAEQVVGAYRDGKFIPGTTRAVANITEDPAEPIELTWTRIGSRVVGHLGGRRLFDLRDAGTARAATVIEGFGSVSKATIERLVQMPE